MDKAPSAESLWRWVTKVQLKVAILDHRLVDIRLRVAKITAGRPCVRVESTAGESDIRNRGSVPSLTETELGQLDVDGRETLDFGD
jgi:hypothetical protein